MTELSTPTGPDRRRDLAAGRVLRPRDGPEDPPRAEPGRRLRRCRPRRPPPTVPLSPSISAAGRPASRVEIEWRRCWRAQARSSCSVKLTDARTVAVRQTDAIEA
ncbi:hypothetical protein HBB16_05290 [Pseudonocardia sp. MCCB 268]|nr:hypothetical protein [Pseudonocardia cytotoxica]